MEQRHPVAAPVWFKWQTESGESRIGKGITRDISGKGMFVLCYPVAVPDCSIEVLVEIPCFSGSGQRVTFHGRGRVLRIESVRGQPIGFGASIAFEDGDDYWGNDQERQQ